MIGTGIEKLSLRLDDSPHATEDEAIAEFTRHAA